ncbi:ankyrin repeat domain-containing protein 13C [Lepeophtheirus salmonis]|uniref:Ankyrin repeat domaincontaining protein 13Clike [Nasonia vitripennis] n=1 Tax=Lepeophtheirus salmonis TaxID=72036 RepID=A0A0K2TSG1_LEPSM|nr:ankyrin repeat domain-containing protein 13C-like [Lepeophtheirus salmonis]
MRGSDKAGLEKEEDYPLHKSAFIGNVAELAQLIRSGEDVSKQDVHGNTALHLAVMLGHKECVHMLIAHGAPVKLKNRLGWSPLAEAISYGDRQIISSLLRKLKLQSKEQMKSRKPDMIAAMQKLGDYVVDLKWDFTSWVPLVSKILPSDLCKISKRGSSIRLDTTLVDFSEMRWERGDITFLYKGDAPTTEESFYVLDNSLKVYQRVRHDETEVEFDEEVDLLMSSDIVSAQISTKPINFSKAQSGWFFKEDRSEMVGNYRANFYAINGMSLETRKRREHLSTEDLQKNRAMLESLTKGNGQILDQPNVNRESLAPPKKADITWDAYISSDPCNCLVLGRPHLCKESSKGFKATVAMSEDFPLTVDMLLNILEIVAPQFKHFQKLRDFVEMKLPPGFPVKVDVPVLPTVSARVTFQDFRWEDKLDENLFEIPKSYNEDPTRFPDL